MNQFSREPRGEEGEPPPPCLKPSAPEAQALPFISARIPTFLDGYPGPGDLRWTTERAVRAWLADGSPPLDSWWTAAMAARDRYRCSEVGRRAAKPSHYWFEDGFHRRAWGGIPSRESARVEIGANPPSVCSACGNSGISGIVPADGTPRAAREAIASGGHWCACESGQAMRRLVEDVPGAPPDPQSGTSGTQSVVAS